MKKTEIRNNTFGIAAAVLLLFIATSPLWTVLLLRRQADLIVNDSLQELTTSSLIKVDMADGFFEMAIALATNDPALREEKLAHIGRLTEEVDLLLKKYEATMENRGDHERFTRMVTLRVSFHQTRRQVVDLLRAEKHDEAIALYNQTGLGQFRGYMESIDQFVKDNINESKERGAEILKLCHRLLFLQGALVLFFAIYAFFVPLVTVYERLTTPKSFLQDV